MNEEEYENYMKEVEEKRCQNIEKLERGEYVSDPEIPGEALSESADSEDNFSSEDECWSEEIEEDTQTDMEKEYHMKMLKHKAMLGAIKDNS